MYKISFYYTNYSKCFIKFLDLGAESDDTDSEEETEGFRFIRGSMVPPQFNMDHGTFQTLPQSQARLARAHMLVKNFLYSNLEHLLLEEK